MAEKAVLTPEERRGREQREVNNWEGMRASGAALRREQQQIQAREAREDGVQPPQKARDEASARQ